jgi:hypothetical protein
MAGRPERKRREAEARSRGRFTSADRERVLQRAQEVGTSQAAQEVGISAATIRTWRKRAADGRVAVSVESERLGGPVAGSGPDSLRDRAARARGAQARAMDQADAMVGSGRAAESRNAVVSATAFGQQAAELEAAAHEQEKHAVELDELAGRLVINVLERVHTALDLTVPREVLEVALVGEIPTELAADARRQVRARMRASVEAQVAADRFVSRHTLPTPERDPERPGGEPEPSPVQPLPRAPGFHTIKKVDVGRRSGRRLSIEQRLRGGG